MIFIKACSIINYIFKVYEQLNDHTWEKQGDLITEYGHGHNTIIP